MTFRNQALLSFTALAIGALAVLGLQTFIKPGVADAAPVAAAAAQLMPVPVTSVQIRSVPVRLTYPARVDAIQELTIQAKATGFLIEQAVSDGSNVKQGELLYRIDARDTQARLDQARAQLERDTASLDYLRSNYDRGSQLAKIGALAKDSFDQRSSLVKQAEAALTIDQAAIRNAELNLEDTSIRAPFTGRLGRNKVATGAYVNGGTTALNTLVQLSPIYVTFNPNERDLSRIQTALRAGDVPVEVSSTVEGSQPQTGKLTFLDNALDRTTGTISARAVIENAEGALLPGQYVRVRVVLGRIDDAKLVPQTAVGSSQLGKFVYTVDDGGVVAQKLIVVEQAEGEHVAVRSGLTGSEKIITGNLQKIGPGLHVAPMPH
ncbi:MAG: efflux transporter, family, subunit [Hyphomicrobiales bacterium]|nr:efflux transporter, family, subunit [Hyphomicrobiales bacterium]